MSRSEARNSAPPRDTLVNIRVAGQDRDLIDRAARLRGKTRSEFMLEAARGAAHDALLDQTVFLMGKAEFGKFRAMLDEAPQHNEGLRDLMRRKSPWDK